jgi:hypothetical protein
MALVSGSGSLAALSSLRLDFVLRHLPRRRRAAPVIIVPSFVLCAYTSHHNSGAVAKIVSNPPFYLTAAELTKFRGLVGRAELFSIRAAGAVVL